MPKYTQGLHITHPHLAREWNYKKNDGTPDQITAGSGKKVWWICSVCNYEWPSTVYNRAHGNGCSSCSGKVVTDKNSLAGVYPNLLKEWHPTKNKINPDQIHAHGNKECWWICSQCKHEWPTQAKKRTKEAHGCPECKKALHTSFPELAFRYYLKQIFEDLKANYPFEFLIPYRNVDLFIPSLNLVMEYDGEYYHRNRLKQDQEKTKLIQQQNFHLIRIREKRLPALSNVTTIEHNHKNDQTLQESIHNLFRTIKEQFSLSESQLSKIEIWKKETIRKHQIQIRAQVQPMEEEGNVKEVKPELCEEWHFEKNAPFLPIHFTAKSNFEVWWKCKKDPKHEWLASPGTRYKGHGCPVCDGKVATPETCLQTVNPALAKEWHPTLNGDLTPLDVLPHSNLEYYWLCPKCNSDYPKKLNERSRGEGCPYCRGLRVNHTNSLAAIYPELAKEWHPTKNGDLTPDKVSKGSKKEVYWICRSGHEWPAPVCNRMRSGRIVGCRTCYDESRQKDKKRKSPTG